MCMHCFQLQKEIQEENKPLEFLYKIKNCSLMLKKKKPQPQDDYFKQKYQMKKAIAAA